MRSVMQLVHALRSHSVFAKWVHHLCSREFHDVRLILEQRGELQYFSVMGSFQRRIARSLIIARAIVTVAILALAAFSLQLHLQKRQLENSNREIFHALLGATETDEFSEPVLKEQDMLLLAQSIRDRDLEIRRYVEGATTQVVEQNLELRDKLNTSGLTEKAIKAIQSSNPIGGSTRGRDEEIALLLREEFAEHSAQNRALREVLGSLPSSMPLPDYVITSGFGIRKHPTSGAPRFHAGVDLVSTGNDDVYPARSGKVVLARAYQAYGQSSSSTVGA